MNSSPVTPGPLRGGEAQPARAANMACASRVVTGIVFVIGSGPIPGPAGEPSLRGAVCPVDAAGTSWLSSVLPWCALPSMVVSQSIHTPSASGGW